VVSFAAPASAAATWGMTVRDTAVAEGDRVQLWEIVDIWGNVDRDVWSELSHRELWAAPEKEGRAQNISISQLEWLLEKYLGPQAERIAVPTSLTIQRGGSVITKEQLEKHVVGFLRARMVGKTGEVQFRNFNGPRQLFLDEAWADVAVEPTTDLDPGRIFLRLSIRAGDGREIRRTTASIQADVWKTVACADGILNSGEHVVPSLVRFESKNHAYLRGEPWDGQGGPYRVKRPVGVGQIIYKDNLEPVPVIEEGETVKLVWEGQNIRLAAKAMAKEDGSTGELINVQNLSSGRDVFARVLNDATVVVE
jgi:flagella basal body P-ring formation protein FlgA